MHIGCKGTKKREKSKGNVFLFSSRRQYFPFLSLSPSAISVTPRRSYSALPYALTPTRGAGFERRKKKEKKYNNLIFLLI